MNAPAFIAGLYKGRAEGGGSGGGLSVVELSTPIEADVILTEAESAELTAVAKNKQCPIMRFQFEGSEVVAVPILAVEGDACAFLVQFLSMLIQFVCPDPDSSWSVTISGS